MAVYYRYRSSVDTFSLPVATPSISVGDLKRLILGTSRHGHSPREGIAISDAQTGHQYTDDIAESVPRNSTVVVRRVPADEEDDAEVARAISVAAGLEWEVMTSIKTEKQTTKTDKSGCGRAYADDWSTEIPVVGGDLMRPYVADLAQLKTLNIERKFGSWKKKN